MKKRRGKRRRGRRRGRGRRRRRGMKLLKKKSFSFSNFKVFFHICGEEERGTEKNGKKHSNQNDPSK